jgi:hypothetical protein
MHLFNRFRDNSLPLAPGGGRGCCRTEKVPYGRGLPAAYRAATRSGGRFVGVGLLGIK